MAELDQDERTATDRHGGGANGRLIGFLLIGLGVAWFLSEIGGLSGETVRAGLLTLLGATLVYTARRGRGGGRSLWPIVLGLILTFSLLANARARFRSFGADPPLPVIHPQSAADLSTEYPGGVNRMVFDLTALSATDLNNQAITIDGSVDVLRVTVPAGVAVRVDSDGDIGRLIVCTRRVDPAPDQNQTYDSEPTAASHLHMHLLAGAGDVRILGCQISPTPPTPPTPPTTPSGP